MTAQELIDAVESNTPLDNPTSFELSLWYAGVGQWDEAHDIVDSMSDPVGTYIHAHLHRQEGDLGNAGYWYSRANRSMPNASVSIREEWEQVVREVL